jgi:Auxin binding protein
MHYFALTLLHTLMSCELAYSVYHKTTGSVDYADCIYLRILAWYSYYRFIYEDWSMPHTAAKLKYPYYWDQECLDSPKDEL